MAMSQTDPWGWSVQDVVHWLQSDFVKFVNDIPHAKIPTVERLTSIVTSQEINGFTLLSEVTTDFLRDECGIKALGQRAVILHAIKALRTRSYIYNGSTGSSYALSDVKPTVAYSVSTDTTTDTSTAIPTNTKAYAHPIGVETATSVTQDLLDQALIQNTPVLGSSNASIGKRAGEIEVQDETGRKRRKLDLSTEGILTTNRSTEFNKGKHDDHECRQYMPNKAMTTDDLFYGHVAVGQEIPDDFEPKLTETDHDDFMVLPGPRCKAVQQFAGRRMMYMLRNNVAHELKYKDKVITVIKPYPSTLAPPNRSQSMSQIFADEHRKSIRLDQTTVLLDGHSDIGMYQLDGEYNGLLEKYKDDPNDELATKWFDDPSDTDSETRAEIEAEKEEVARARKMLLLREDCETIVAAIINDYATDWTEQKRDGLESTKASKVWRSVRTSGKRGRLLLDSYKSSIIKLEERLAALRVNILSESWTSKNDLIAQCSMLQPTVYELEELRWNIEVCKRTEVPGSTIRKTRLGASRPQKPQATTNSDDDMLDFVIDDHVATYDVPHVSPPPPSSPPALPFSLTRNVDKLTELRRDLEADFIFEQAQADTDIDADIDSPAHEDLAPLIDAAAKSDDDSSYHEKSNEDDIPSSENDARLPTNEVTKLIDMEEKMFSKNKVPVSNTRPEREIIVLSSDSGDSPVRPAKEMIKSKIKKERVSGKPETATSSEIESWDLDNLVVDGDRKRLLSKIILSLELEIKVNMCDLCKDCEDASELAGQVQSYLTSSSSAWDHGDVLRQFCKLLACWEECSPRGWDTPLDKVKLSRIDESSLVSWAAYVFQVLPRISSFMNERESVHVTSATDSTDSDVIPAKRKKKKKLTREESSQAKAAAVSRTQAFTRMAKFQESQQHNSDHLNLLQMIPGSEHDDENIAVNVVRSGKEQPIYIHSSISKQLKAHQIDGVQFLWRETTNRKAEGCVLAHTMGLGKTCQTITYLITLKQTMENTAIKNQLPKDMRQFYTLILCPPAVLQNWIAEINMWSPRRNFFKVWRIDSTGNDPLERLEVLQDWREEGGILLIGYSMFQRFTKILFEQRELKADGMEKPMKGLSVEDMQDAAKILTQTPNIVVADEAHTLKNERALISKAVRKFKTKRRIALTGTPMSNNTQEIFAAIDWVAPNFLGPASDFKATFTGPIEQGLWEDSTSSERRKSKIQLTALNSEIAPKINRADITALKGSLKPKTEFVLKIPLTKLQQDLYIMMIDFFLGRADQIQGQQSTLLFQWISQLTALVVDPLALKYKLEMPIKSSKKKKQKLKDRDMDKDETNIDGSGFVEPAPEEDELFGDEDVRDMGFTETFIQEVLAVIPEKVIMLDLSYRIWLTQQIIYKSRAVGDKLLIFSQWIPTLKSMGRVLNNLSINWALIDGSKKMADRDRILADFKEGRYDVVLISTRAGGQGLNMQTANRVVLLDFSWNPTWEEQAVGRAYRFGQTKPVYVYRFVSGGTFEERLYKMNMFKSSLFSRVVDKKSPTRIGAQTDLKDWLFHPREVEQGDIESEFGKDEQVLDQILKSKTCVDGSLIRSIKTMETLQKEDGEAPLDEQEQREVEANIKEMRRLRERVSLPVAPLGGLPVPFSTAPAGQSVQRPWMPVASTSAPTSFSKSIKGVILQDHLDQTVKQPITPKTPFGLLPTNHHRDASQSVQVPGESTAPSQNGRRASVMNERPSEPRKIATNGSNAT